MQISSKNLDVDRKTLFFINVFFEHCYGCKFEDLIIEFTYSFKVISFFSSNKLYSSHELMRLVPNKPTIFKINKLENQMPNDTSTAPNILWHALHHIFCIIDDPSLEEIVTTDPASCTKTIQISCLPPKAQLKLLETCFKPNRIFSLDLCRTNKMTNSRAILSTLTNKNNSLNKKIEDALKILNIYESTCIEFDLASFDA